MGLADSSPMSLLRESGYKEGGQQRSINSIGSSMDFTLVPNP